MLREKNMDEEEQRQQTKRRDKKNDARGGTEKA